MAEYRRGNFVDALKHLEDAKTGFESGNEDFNENTTICQYFASMAHYRLGDTDAARAAFHDARNRQQKWETNLRNSLFRAWLDWQLAEVVRRDTGH